MHRETRETWTREPTKCNERNRTKEGRRDKEWTQGLGERQRDGGEGMNVNANPTQCEGQNDGRTDE